MSHDDILDADAIAMLQSMSSDDGGQFFNELIDIFLGDTPARIEEVRAALSGGDLSTGQRAAHSIKGAAGNFGATQLAHLAHEIEQLAKNSDLSAMAIALPKLEAEYARVKVALEAVRIK